MADMPDHGVRQNEVSRIGFVGAGTVATALAMGLHAQGYMVVAVASRSRPSAAALARRIPHCQVYDDPQAVVDAANMVFLTVPDDAIARVAASIHWRSGVAAVHCSGATDLDVFEPARVAGAEIGGFHPLQMFADVDAAVASLPGTTFTLAGDAPLAERLEAMARALGGRTIHLPPGKRALYHASAAFVGPFVIALLQEASRLWHHFGVTEGDALAALIPLLRGTIAGVERAGLAGGMGGPVSRGDTGTIRKHLAALEDTGPEVAVLYRDLMLRTLPLAVARGTLPKSRAQELHDLLTSPGNEPMMHDRDETN